MEVKIGDKVMARDEHGSGGQFPGILLSLSPAFGDKGELLGNKAEVLDTTFADPKYQSIKTAVTWQPVF